ncbi:MAG: hypothetical protein ABS35_25220 [Kaistia sp. SCN 65-12]|nr:MAG: hypothetical protein ABS35_25220 [Kaistia sp. SCN 65-12]
MAGNKRVEFDPHGNALGSCEAPDGDLFRAAISIDDAEVVLGDEMHLVIDPWILADASLKAGLDDLADKLHSHPSFAAGNRILQRLRCGLGTNLGYDAIEIMIALRDPDKAANLSNAIAASPDDRDAGRH